MTIASLALGLHVKHQPYIILASLSAYIQDCRKFTWIPPAFATHTRSLQDHTSFVTAVLGHLIFTRYCMSIYGLCTFVDAVQPTCVLESSARSFILSTRRSFPDLESMNEDHPSRKKPQRLLKPSHPDHHPSDQSRRNVTDGNQVWTSTLISVCYS